MSERGPKGTQPEEDQRKTGIRIPVPWSRDPIEVRGLGTILTLTLVTICLTAYMVWKMSEEVTVAHALSVTQHVRLEEAVTEQTYVLSLKQEDREKLNIAMPDSLRKKLRRRNGSD